MSDEPEITVQSDEPSNAEAVFSRDFCYATIRKLRAEIDATRDNARSAFLCFSIGWLFERHLDDVQQAATHYQEALSRDPDLIPAMRALRRRMLHQGNWTRYLELIDAELRGVKDRSARAQLLVEKAEVLDIQLDDHEGALAALERAREEDPACIQALWCLEHLHRTHREEKELAETLDLITEALPEGSLRHIARYEAARLREVALDDPVTAAEEYEALLEGGDDDPRARAALRRLFLRSKDYRRYVEDLKVEAKGLSGRERARVLYTVARTLNDRMGELVESISVLEQALDAHPESSLVLAELTRLYPLVGKLEQLASCYRSQLSFATDPRQKAALHHRIGQLYEEELRDDSRAEAAYRSALAEDPENRPTIQSLAVFFQRRGRWDELVQLHLDEAGKTESPLRKALAFHRGAEILESQHSDARAAELYGRALSTLPSFVPSLNALEKLLERTGDHDGLVKLLAERAGREENPKLKVGLLERVARIQEEKLGDKEGAISRYREIQDIDPTSRMAVSALVRLTRELDRWKDHVQWLGREAELSDDDQHVVYVLLGIGEIQENRLGDEEAAIETYRRLMGVDPFYAPAIRNLGRLYHRRAMWNDLIGLHRQELDTTTEPDEKSLLHYKVGRIFEDRLKDLDEASSSYKAAVMENPQNFAANWALYRIYMKREDWLSIIDILENEANALPEGNQRALALTRVGELWEEPLGRLDMAADAYTQALRATPGCTEAREALIRLSEQESDWDHLVDLLYQEFQTSVDPREQYRIAMQLGEVLLERSKNPRKAMEWYMKALGLEPGSLAALRGTEHALIAAGEWRSFMEVRRRLIDLCVEEQTRLALFHGMVMLSHLHDRDAVQAGESAVAEFADLDFGWTGSLMDLMLERELLERGDPGTVLRWIESRIGRKDGIESMRLADSFERASALLRAGLPGESAAALMQVDSGPAAVLSLILQERLSDKVLGNARMVEISSRLADELQRPAFKAESLAKRGMARLGNPEERLRGLSDLEQALALDPESVEAFTGLVQALGSEARWGDLVAALKELAKRVKLPDRAVEVWGTLGHLEWRRLGDKASAIKSFNQVLRFDAKHPATLASLLELYVEGEMENEAIAVCRHLMGSAKDPAVFTDAALRLADLLDREDRDTGEAVLALEEVVERDPTNRKVLARLAKIQRKNGAYQEALQLVERLVASEDDPAVRGDLLVDQAEIAALGGKGDAACIEILDRAFAEGAASERALQKYVEVLGKSGRWELLVRKMEDHLARMGDEDPRTRGFVLAQLGDLYRERLRDPVKAAERLRESFDLDPSCGETGRKVVAGLVEGGKLDEALEVAERMLEAEPLCFEVMPLLVAVLEGKDHGPRAMAAAQAAQYMGVADDGIVKLASEMRRIGKDGPREALGEDDLATVRADALDHPARKVLEALGRPGSRVLRKGLSDYGVERGDRIGSDHAQGGVLALECGRIGKLLGAGDFDVFLIPSHGAEVVVELHDPPALLFSVLITELSEIEQRIMAVHALAQVAFRTSPAGKLARGRLEELLVATARIFVPDFGSGVTGLKHVEELRAAVDMALDKKDRKEMKPLVEEFTRGGWVDYDEWLLDMQKTAARLSFLATGDLGAVLDSIKKRDPELVGVPLSTPASRREALTRSEVAVDLVRFTLDPATAALWGRLYRAR